MFYVVSPLRVRGAVLNAIAAAFPNCAFTETDEGCRVAGDVEGGELTLLALSAGATAVSEVPLSDESPLAFSESPGEEDSPTMEEGKEEAGVEEAERSFIEVAHGSGFSVSFSSAEKGISFCQKLAGKVIFDEPPTRWWGGKFIVSLYGDRGDIGEVAEDLDGTVL